MVYICEKVHKKHPSIFTVYSEIVRNQSCVEYPIVPSRGRIIPKKDIQVYGWHKLLKKWVEKHVKIGVFHSCNATAKGNVTTDSIQNCLINFFNNNFKF